MDEDRKIAGGPEAETADKEVVDPADLAGPVLASYKPSAEALKLHAGNMTRVAFAEALLAAGRWEDCVAFMAHSLPRRRAVWWAVQCARESFKGSQTGPADSEALDAAEKWAVEPTEKRRRAAEKAAQAVEFSTIPGAAAAAAFFSSGTISLPDAPMVAPPPEVCADLVKTAVVCSVVRAGSPEKQGELRASFMGLARDLDKTAARWKEVALAVAAEHTVKGGEVDSEKERLRVAAGSEADALPSSIEDKRMFAEIETALGPKMAAEKAQAEKIEAMKKNQREAEEKEKSKGKP